MPDRFAERRSSVDERLDAPAKPSGKAQVTLTDLSLRLRFGVKGTGALGWMKRQAVTLPVKDNTAVSHGATMLVARLSPGEALLLDLRDGKVLERLAASLPERGNSGAYPVPRMDTHAWFRLEGPDVPFMFAKLCAVDLRPEKFANLSVAQTIAARVSVIVIRHDVQNAPCYYLLTDSASAIYVWDCIVDAMAEFGGTVGTL